MRKKTLRILHLSKFYPPHKGGVENFLRDLAREQGKSHQLAVLAHGSNNGAFSSRKQDGICIHEVPTAFNLLYTPLAPRYPLFLKKTLREFHPDVIHVHLPNLSPFFLLLTGTNGIPTIIHWHADVPNRCEDWRLSVLYKFFYRFLERALLKKAGAIIVTSPYYLDSSIPLQPFRHKAKVVPLGVDMSRLLGPHHYKQTRENGQIRPFHLISVGRLTYYKGFEYLIEALALLKNRNIVLDIVGEGPERAKLLQKIASTRTGEKVRLRGELSDEKLNSLMGSADAFCLPSIERTEAFGLVLLEAMYYKLPLITTKIEGSGVCWVNKDGETGLSVPIKSPKKLAEAISTLMDRPDLSKIFGRNARKRLENKFTIDRVSMEIERIYLMLLERTNKR